jgi:hypothetical protein
MSRGLDIAKMQAAFDRAAHKAVHGTREERSGRFSLNKDPGGKANLSPHTEKLAEAPVTAGASKDVAEEGMQKMSENSSG